MNPLIAAAVIALLLAIRLAVPCAVVGGICYALDRLMERWEKEALLNQGITTE